MDFFFFTIHSWCFFYLGCRGGFWASFSFWGEGMFRLSQVAGEIIGGDFDLFRTRVKLSTCPPIFSWEIYWAWHFLLFLGGIFKWGGDSKIFLEDFSAWGSSSGVWGGLAWAISPRPGLVSVI